MVRVLGVDVAVLNCLCACYIQPMPCIVLSELVARNCMTYQPGCGCGALLFLKPIDEVLNRLCGYWI